MTKLICLIFSHDWNMVGYNVHCMRCGAKPTVSDARKQWRLIR